MVKWLSPHAAGAARHAPGSARAGQRGVLERGSVEGEVFHRGAVQALAADGSQVTPRLAALVRNQLIRPDRSQLAGEDGFRFRHLLIRDAAYEALPKSTRAELHERFAAWLAHHGAELVELDEVLGYHLEQACRYRAELGMAVTTTLAEAATAPPDRRRAPGAAARELRRRREHVRAGRRACPSARGRPRARNRARRVTVLGGRRRGRAAAGGSIAERAAAAGDQVGELCGQIKAGMVRISLEPEGATESWGPRRSGAARVRGRRRRTRAVHRLHALGAGGEQRAQMDARWRHTSGPPPTPSRRGCRRSSSNGAPAAGSYGATAVSEVLAWLDEQEARAGEHHWLRMYRALALAMLGRFDEARAILAGTRAELAERGGGMLARA